MNVRKIRIGHPKRGRGAGVAGGAGAASAGFVVISDMTDLLMIR
jgi:hypothetical protein